MVLIGYRRIFSCAMAVMVALLLGREPATRAATPREPALWAWCWSATVPADKNLYPMIWVHRSGYATAAKIAAEAWHLPSGRVALFMWNAAPTLLKSPLDTCRTPVGQPTAFPSPWLGVGAAKIAKRMTAFFQGYKAAGGRLNFVALDYEAGLSNWSLTAAGVKAISADPRSAALAKWLGFSDLPSIFKPGAHRHTWNMLMGRIVAKALDQAYFAPARAVFPDVRGNNFGGIDLLGKNIAPDVNGHYQPCESVFGNTQGPGLLGGIRQLAGDTLGGQVYGHSPFAVLRYEMLLVQDARRSRSLPLVPWVAYASYGDNIPYYQDLIYQLALRGANQFIYWNPRPWAKGQKPMATAHDDKILNGCLTVLNKKLGATPGKALPTPTITWSTPLLVAGRTTSSGDILYRVTVAPGITAITANPGNRQIKIGSQPGVWVRSPAGQPLTFTVGY